MINMWHIVTALYDMMSHTSVKIIKLYVWRFFYTDQNSFKNMNAINSYLEPNLAISSQLFSIVNSHFRP